MKSIYSGMIAILLATVAVGNAAEAPKIVTSAPGKPLPVRQWVERPMGGWENAGKMYMGGNGGKHGRCFYHPVLKVMVFAGGDWHSSMPVSGDGEGSEIWTLNCATNTWKMLRAREVSGENQPGGPDSVGWAYDSKRNRGIMNPGFYFITQGEGGKKSNHGEINGWGGYEFSFKTNKFNGPDAVVGLPPPPKSWGGDGDAAWSVCDPVNDELVRIRNGATLERLNLETKTWRVSPVWLTPTWNPVPNRSQSIIDVKGRAVYFLDAYGDKGGVASGVTTPARGPALIKVSLEDGSTSTILLPEKYVIPTEGPETYLVFDPINRLVLVPNNTGMGQTPLSGLGIYNVETKKWEWEAVPAEAYGSVWGFDENVGAMMCIGKRTTPTAYYLYKPK